ncbi:MAG: DUF2975 domain-containing protein [Sphingomonadales bacterium]|nr:DUF2975 domain-containing protein [Sphingomonadales bacterium]
MPRPFRDPLLAGTRLLLVVSGVIFLVGGVAALGALIPVWAFGGRVIAWLAAHADAPPVGRDALGAVSALLGGIIAGDALTIQFLRNLVAIIDTVGQGSPFISANAKRLREMGWLVLAMQAMLVAALFLTPWFRQALGSRHFFIPFSLAGLITALLLFILARVFEQGTRLAEDVEGTV